MFLQPLFILPFIILPDFAQLSWSQSTICKSGLRFARRLCPGNNVLEIFPSALDLRCDLLHVGSGKSENGQSDSLGLRLAPLLAQQLQGTLTLCEGPGTHFDLRFRRAPNAPDTPLP